MLADGCLERDVEIEYATFDATAQSNSFACEKSTA